MARKTKVVTIEGKDIVVKELTVKQVLGLFSKDGAKFGDITLPDVVDKFQDLLPIATGMTADELMEMAPSELVTIYDTFKEVNAVFFEVLASLGITKILAEVKTSTVQNFSGLFANYLQVATDKQSGNTDMSSLP